MSRSLGTFEMMILLALLKLEDDAYGVRIRREIEARTGRAVSSGAVYTTLERLENRGFVHSWMGEPTAQRGGRRKKHYRLDASGGRALHRSLDALQRMSAELMPKLAGFSGAPETGR